MDMAKLFGCKREARPMSQERTKVHRWGFKRRTWKLWTGTGQYEICECLADDEI